MTETARTAVELPFAAITPTGWLADQLRLQADGLTGRLEEIWPDVGPDSAWRGGDGEGWERGPYYLDGLVPLAHLLRDEALIAKVAPWVEWILASQDGVGWFGPDGDDWWPRVIAGKVLIQHAEATGDERVLPFLQRYLAHQLRSLPGRPLREWASARSDDAALVALWVHDRTGEPWLLELVDLLRAQGVDWTGYLTTDLITGPAKTFDHRTHGVNVAMGLKAGAIAHRRSPDPAHEAGTAASFAALDRWHGQVHGFFSGDEFLGGREAVAGIETCLVVELMFSLETLARTFDDGGWGDKLEAAAVNLLAASCDPRMLAHQYHQQATQLHSSVHRRNWSYSGDDANVFGLEPHFGCCTANLHQGWPRFARSLWARDADGGLRAVAWAPVRLDVETDGGALAVDVRTSYPFTDRIELHVTGADGVGAVPLRLRVPAWASRATLEIDGERVPVAPERGYVEVARDWAGEHVVTLVLPMYARVERRERQAAGVFLGPWSMVASPGETWHPVPDAPGLGEWHIHPRSTWNWAIGGVDRCDAWPVTLGAPGEVPFALGASPVAVEVPAAQAYGWDTVGHDPAPTPFSPVMESGPPGTIRLVPYGSARLRVTELPVLLDRAPTSA